MAVNVALRGRVSFSQVATNVAIPGDFAQVGGRFYYSYVDRRGNGHMKVSTNGGRSWYHYDSMGAVGSVSARGRWVAWHNGPRITLYDLEQQWVIADGYPNNPETGPQKYSGVVPVPELAAVRFSTSTNPMGVYKQVSNFTQWDGPTVGTSGPGHGFGTTAERTFLGLWGDREYRPGGDGLIGEAYRHIVHYLGSPSLDFITWHARGFADVKIPYDEDLGYNGWGPHEVPLGVYLDSPYGTQGFDGALLLTEGIIGSGRGFGFNNVLPQVRYTTRSHRNQVGLRYVRDLNSQTENEFAHGGAAVDELGPIAAARGFIAGVPGAVFADSAGNLCMTRRAGSPWTAVKCYGAPASGKVTRVWVPTSAGGVYAGIYGGGEAWFLIDPDPDFIPRGNLIGGDYVHGGADLAQARGAKREVNFW